MIKCINVTWWYFSLLSIINYHPFLFTYCNIQSKHTEVAFSRAKLYFSFHRGMKPLIYCVFSTLREFAHIRDMYTTTNCWSCRWDYLNLNRVARRSCRGALFIVREDPPPVFQVLSWDARRCTLYVCTCVCSREGGSGEEERERKEDHIRTKHPYDFQNTYEHAAITKGPLWCRCISMDQECSWEFRDPI